jgi:hypothetical protein
MRVTLTTEDELRAAAVGYARQRIAVQHQRKPRHFGGSRWGGHIEGACAELAGSIGLDLPWTGEEVWETPPATRVPDLGERTEVRWVAPSRYESILNYDAARDLDDRFYVLVVGFAPTFDIVGFLRGADCRQPAWLHQYPERAVYRVPASSLRPL